MTYKKWFCLVLTGVAVIFCVVAAINWVIDPMLCFNHDTSFAERRYFYNERQQKTNYLVNRKPEIDTLILGSSRMMAVEPKLWGGSGFNYAVPAGMPHEYADLLNNVKKSTGELPETIVVGIDFFGADVAYYDIKYAQASRTAYARAKADKFSYLFNFKVLKYALGQLYCNPKKESRWLFMYRRGILSLTLAPPHSGSPANENPKRRWMKENFDNVGDRYVKKHMYNEKYMSYLKDFVFSASDAKIIPYVPPIGTPLLEAVFSCPESISAYERWLKETVSVFGGIWCFIGVNPVTLNPDLWREPSHHFTEVGMYIRNRIKNTGEAPEDFGVFLTEENITEYIEEIKAKLAQLKANRDKDPWRPYADE